MTLETQRNVYEQTKDKLVEKVINDSRETQEIRQRMEMVRSDLEDDVHEIVEDARVMSEWRYYVRTYPWACLGAALAVGYLVVPRRVFLRGMQSDSQTLVELAKQSQMLVTPNTPPKGGVRSKLLTYVGNQVTRIVLSYVAQQAGKLFTLQAVGSQQDDQP